MTAVAAHAKPAPELTLKSLDGRTVHLSDYRGKVVLLNFWATWCGGCRVEMPRLVELSRKYRARGLEIIGVSMDDAGNDVVARFVQALHVPYTIVSGDDAVAQTYGGIQFLPQTFVIDRQGEVVESVAGPPEERPFDELIQSLLRDSAR
jgi:peroxiredoxin